MTAKCAGCSDEATEPIENEGTDAGTQVEVKEQPDAPGSPVEGRG